MDKAGIVISIVVVIIGVGFATFSSNFVSDVSESKNLVDEYPEKAKMLLNKLNHIDQTLLNPYDVEK